jgi:hypothetical protein
MGLLLIGDVSNCHSSRAATSRIIEAEDSQFVMRGLDPRIPIRGTSCLPKRDRRDKPGDDEESVSGHDLRALYGGMGFA